jgi:hypothetical protein
VSGLHAEEGKEGTAVRTAVAAVDVKLLESGQVSLQMILEWKVRWLGLEGCTKRSTSAKQEVVDPRF